MDSLRFVRGLPPMPISASGAAGRHQSPAAQVSVAGPRAEAEEVEGRRKRGNWVLNILRVGSTWEKGREKKVAVDAGEDLVEGLGADSRCLDCDECVVDDEEREVFDRDSFSRLLRRVSIVEMEIYAKMSYLGRLAYSIPKIKPASLLKYHGLRFITSSLEKRAKSSNAEEKTPDPNKPEEKLPNNVTSSESSTVAEDNEKQNKKTPIISPSTAYHIAAAAASFVQSQTKSIIPFGAPKAKDGKDSEDENAISCSEMASFVATTNSVTAVVAGKEEMKQAVAKDLSSAQSSPSEWYICDDDKSGTRYFIIQGSESLASWQANLLFEPIQFEGLDVLVHRGIYEAAKGIYQQMLPEVKAHLKARGDSATLRFTGHSLGGSLSLLVNLMLLIRGEAPSSALLPVITFGAPTIMCGGDYLLRKLGLPQTHVQAITMHRDIVPRAFSCNYPDHVAKILKAVNGNFRNHPCLQHQKLLYAPMGKLLILQPEEKFSPNHHLLPPGSGLYLLGHPLSNSDDSMKHLLSAQLAFLNSPHPLEILSDRSAYGSEGTIYRDHDMDAYLRSVRSVIRRELKLIRKAKRQSRRILWWPLVSTQGSDAIIGQRARLTNSNQHHFNFVGVFNGGKDTLKRFGRIIASRNVQLFIVFLAPARLLVMGTLSLFPH
ncbi:uncharacterized protein LOC109850536 [Asparagus officinalis]|uniref:uncharacterized protein LOC109850536 n=1 Tax=Asparagus officinalis TaxID=4686 RepID=UPI00098E80F2|nr:uncharacterized protein LOC109850536 [Asparagus officinalis]